MRVAQDIPRLEEQLNHEDRQTRLRALRELKHLADTGAAGIEAPKPWVNMHCHTFYSYNAQGYSPCRVAWEMVKRGVSLAAMIDFDVLDGLDEGLAASDALLYPFAVGLETRVYVSDFARDVLNSPNEPGIAYYCGVGFASGPPENSDANRTLSKLRLLARRRNEAMLERINDYLGQVELDYDADVLPLSAAGNATERHMLVALEHRAEEVFSDAQKRAHFWAAKLRQSEDEIQRLMKDPVQFRNVMRKQLMKYGSPGYATPEPSSFPTLNEVVQCIRDCGAMPMYAWLDGTNSGEEDAELLVDYFLNAGGTGINIIPDRNWNLKDPDEKARKVSRLNEIIRVARNRHLPLNVGTEINSPSQPIVDHFDSPELRPHVPAFLEGAQIVWGHSLLLRYGGFGYLSAQADAAFGKDVKKKNEFFLEVGRRPVPHGASLGRLREVARAADAKAVLRVLAQ